MENPLGVLVKGLTTSKTVSPLMAKGMQIVHHLKREKIIKRAAFLLNKNKDSKNSQTPREG